MVFPDHTHILFLEQLQHWLGRHSTGWKEYSVVLASMKLTECHRMAIPGDPMCGLHIVRKGYVHQAIYNFIEEAEAGHRSFILKGLPVQLRLQ